MYGYGVGEGVPGLDLGEDAGQDELVLDVLHHPRRQHRHPGLQQHDQRVTLTHTPLTAGERGFHIDIKYLQIAI